MPFKLVWETYEGGKRRFSPHWSSGAKAYIRGHYAGQPYFESLRTSDRNIAKRDFALREAEIIKHHEASKHQIPGRCNFAHAVKIYMGTSDPKVVDPTGRIAKIVDAIDHKKFLDELSQTDLDDLAKKLRPKAGPKTLNREVYTPFISVYNAAVGDRKAPERRWRRPRGANDEFYTTPPTDEDISKLIDCAMDTHGRGPKKAVRNRAAILFVTLTGERTSAVIKLLLNNVTLSDNPDGDPAKDIGSVYFGKTKNGKPRRVQLPPILVRALREHIAVNEVKPTDRLFGWTSRFALAQMIRKARKAAGLDAVRPHDVGRHSFGRRMTAAGLDRRQLKKAGNWDSDAAVARYEHLAEDVITETVRNVDTSGFVTIDVTRNKPGNKRDYSIKKARKS